MIDLMVELMVDLDKNDELMQQMQKHHDFHRLQNERRVRLGCRYSMEPECVFQCEDAFNLQIAVGAVQLPPVPGRDVGLAGDHVAALVVDALPYVLPRSVPRLEAATP